MPLTPLVLLVDDQEWTSRSIESILRPKGHVVLKAYTGQQALDLVQKVSPDALIVDVHLPDIDGIDLVRQLRESPTIRSMTPILMITADSVGRAERLEALAAGNVVSGARFGLGTVMPWRRKAATCSTRKNTSMPGNTPACSAKNRVNV